MRFRRDIGWFLINRDMQIDQKASPQRHKVFTKGSQRNPNHARELDLCDFPFEPHHVELPNLLLCGSFAETLCLCGEVFFRKFLDDAEHHDGNRDEPKTLQVKQWAGWRSNPRLRVFSPPLDRLSYRPIKRQGPMRVHRASTNQPMNGRRRASASLRDQERTMRRSTGATAHRSLFVGGMEPGEPHDDLEGLGFFPTRRPRFSHRPCRVL